MAAPDLEYLEMTDFTPGIWSNNNLAGGINVTSDNPCKAQEAGTYGCRSLPGGGLGPLPRRKFSFRLQTIPHAGHGHTYVNCGLGTYGFVFAEPMTSTNGLHRVEAHVLITYADAGPTGNWDNHAVWIREHLMMDAPRTTETIYSQATTDAVHKVGYLFAHFLKTRMNTDTPLEPGVPVTVCVWSSDDQLMHINQIYPDPSAPNGSGSRQLEGSDEVYRRAVAHQGRIVLGVYDAPKHGAGTEISIDENIVWTNVNDNTLDDPIPSVFVPESDSTISDWASMTANTLIVIKRLGGGFLLQGSLGDTTAVRLPNIKSPDGTAYVMGTNTPIGFVYSAGDAGLYVWNGGDASEPISQQLDGRTFTTIRGIDRLGAVGQIDRWMDLIVAPDGWVCDLDSMGWWRIEHPDEPDALVQPIVFWSATNYQGQLVGAARTFTDADPEFLYIYEYSSLRYDWNWRSHPFWMTQNRTLSTRQVLIAAQGHGTITVTLMNERGDQYPVTVTVNSDQIRNFRLDANMDAENLIVDIAAQGDTGAGEGTTQAPLLHRLFIGYDPDGGHQIRNADG